MLHPQMVQRIWEIFGKAEVDLFASEDNSHCPTYYLKVRDALAHEWPNLLLYAFPPIALISQVIRRIKDVRANSAARSSPMAHSPETGPPLSSERDNMAPSARSVGPAPLAARREPASFPESVLNTNSEATAPSTRRLYTLKWSVFSTWCLDRGENPSTSDLSVVLSFLQDRIALKLSGWLLACFGPGSTEYVSVIWNDHPGRA